MDIIGQLESQVFHSKTSWGSMGSIAQGGDNRHQAQWEAGRGNLGEEHLV